MVCKSAFYFCTVVFAATFIEVLLSFFDHDLRILGSSSITLKMKIGNSTTMTDYFVIELHAPFSHISILPGFLVFMYQPDSPTLLSETDW